MIHRTKFVIARQSVIRTLAGAAFVSATLSGCGGDDDAQAAVKQAGRSFTSISVGDSNSNPSYSEKSYKATEQALAAHAGNGNGYAQAAAVGVAMAKRGQAALASQQASRAENDAILQARIIRGMINEWLTMDAIAQAAGMFDPREDIREIQGIIELRRDDISKYESQMEHINAEISDRESKISDLRKLADEQRNQAGALELQIPRVSAQEGADIASQVREFTLRSDQYELEAQRIEGVVGQLRPGAREVSLNVGKARSQIDLLEKAIAELRERARSSEEDAQQARANANDAVQRINEAVDRYQSLRDNEVSAANERAISLVRGAINALRDAGDVVKQSAALNKADSQQLLAELTMRQAAGEREEALMYQSLLDAKISGDWQSAIDAALQQSQELTEAAKQAYLSAAASLRSARMRVDVADRLEATAARLEHLGGLEPEPADMPDEISEPDPIETDQPEQSALDQSGMMLEEIMAQVPEEMRDTVSGQLQGLLDALAAIDDADTLRAMLTQIDEQAASMPEEFAIGFNFVRRQILNRIDEIESDG